MATVLIWMGCRSCEAPADYVAGVVVAAHEGHSAETGALELAVVEVDAVDPEAALAVDEVTVGGGLDLRGVDLVEVAGVAGELPGELVVGLADGGGVVAGPARRLSTSLPQVSRTLSMSRASELMARREAVGSSPKGRMYFLSPVQR